MQKLVFEKAWKHTISKLDQQWIENKFEQTNAQQDMFVPLRTARNYRNDLLVTVLIHNTTAQPLDIRTVTLQLVEENREITSYTFNEPRLLLHAKTSMPWTFIFPQSLLPENLSEERVYLTRKHSEAGT